MPHQQTKFSRSCAAPVIVAASSMLILSMAIVTPAEARGGHGSGGHGHHHGFGSHEIRGDGGGGSGSIAGDRRHGNDAYVKAASEEEGEILNTKIKSICRGC